MFLLAEDLESLSESGGKNVTKEDLKSKRRTEDIKKRYEDRGVIIKEKLQKVMDMWGPRIQEYLFKLTPEDGKAMRETIVKSEIFPYMREFIEKIKSGTSLKAGFTNLLNTKEIADKALQFIFDERTDPGQYAWKTLLTDYITTKGFESPLFIDAIKLLLYKNLKESEGKAGAALRNELRDVSWDTVRKQYSDGDVKSFLSEQAGQANGIRDGIQELNKNIKGAIRTSENKGAFQNFFGRLRTWNSIMGKDLEVKLERIVAGDDPSPIKMDKTTRSKMVTEYEETDPRIKDQLNKLEGERDILEKKIEETPTEDPEKTLELDDLKKQILELESKSVKKERLDISTPEGLKFLDKVIEKLVEERLQKAYTKQASYSDFIASTFNFLKIKGQFNETYL